LVRAKLQSADRTLPCDGGEDCGIYRKTGKIFGSNPDPSDPGTRLVRALNIETGGDFAAVDAKTGETLWTFRGNDSWRASPMTYEVDGRQYVAGMVGTNLVSFALDYR
jgi:alcohol dehydrogenase (cytochrome c)